MLVILTFASAFVGIRHELLAGLLFVVALGLLGAALFTLAREVRIALNEFDHFPRLSEALHEDPRCTVTAATRSPLFFGLATREQAERMADVVHARLLKRAGLVTSTVSTGQQWDAPNAWAPMQWIGLSDYGEIALAETIAQRWMLKVISAYRATGKPMEKYNAEDPSLVTDGEEYPTQDGFGWTNGVLRKLLVLYPKAVAPRPRRELVCQLASQRQRAGGPDAGGQAARCRPLDTARSPSRHLRPSKHLQTDGE